MYTQYFKILGHLANDFFFSRLVFRPLLIAILLVYITNGDKMFENVDEHPHISHPLWTSNGSFDENTIVFSEMGFLPSSLSFVNYTVTINFTTIMESIEKFWVNASSIIVLHKDKLKVSQFQLRYKRVKAKAGNIRFYVSGYSTGKRSAASVVKSLSHIAHWFLSGYNTYKTYKNSESIDELDEEMELVVYSQKHGFEDFQNQVDEIREVISDFANLTNERTTVLEQMMGINNVMHELEDGINKIERGVHSAIQGSLSPDLIDFDRASDFIFNIIRKVKEDGYETLDDFHPWDIFSLPYTIDFDTNTDIMKVSLHIPLWRKSGALKLSRYIPHTWSSYTSFGLFSFRPQIDEDIIGVSYNQKQFLLLNSGDIASCHQLRNFFLCKETNRVLNSDFLSTCLSSIYKKNSNGIKDNCPLRNVPSADALVEPLTNEKFKISLKKTN